MTSTDAACPDRMSDARAVVARAIDSIALVHPAIDTAIALGSDDRLEICIRVPERDTGEEVEFCFYLEVPWIALSRTPSRDEVVDWIYDRLRDAWVHELNEALHVDGARRRDLHDERGRALTLPYP
jgi:hypothetical protein